MIEIKFLGTGGQGVVIASEILARACFEEGLYPQSFSIFGGERRGAPVAAFVRVSDQKIWLKCEIDRPNHLILFDPSLVSEKEVGLQVVPGGMLLFNTEERLRPRALKEYRIGVIDAGDVAKRNGLGGIVNTSVLGSYVRLSQIVKLETLLKVIRETVPTAVEPNISAAREAYERIFLLR
jgi:2-oxoacid:acceptor oxidoreductase gamma subunit (pyruvate/2-ketoisovalerate family)